MAKSDLLEVLAGVHDFYGKDFSEFAAQVWIKALESFDSKRVTEAFSSHVMDPERCQWMPKPGDIVRVLQGTYTDRALLEWGKVLEAIRVVGGYRSVVFDDPATMASIQDIGGWQSICQGNEDDLPHVQRRFAASYSAYARKPGHAYPNKLIGLCEEQNRLHGYPVEAPMMVGNHGACGAILMDGSSGPKAEIAQLVGAALKGIK